MFHMSCEMDRHISHLTSMIVLLMGAGPAIFSSRFSLPRMLARKQSASARKVGDETSIFGASVRCWGSRNVLPTRSKLPSQAASASHAATCVTEASAWDSKRTRTARGKYTATRWKLHCQGPADFARASDGHERRICSFESAQLPCACARWPQAATHSRAQQWCARRLRGPHRAVAGMTAQLAATVSPGSAIVPVGGNRRRLACRPIFAVTERQRQLQLRFGPPQSRSACIIARPFQPS